MKVVLLAGGLGTRMRGDSEFGPKPMVKIGGKPVLWHIMKIFATQGFNDFIICAGYKGEHIKEYFHNYRFYNSDFQVSIGHEDSIEFFSDQLVQQLKVTVVDTGINSLTADRILQVKPYVGDQPFFCTYGDGIADVNLNELVNVHRQTKTIATLTTTRPTSRFGLVETDAKGIVSKFSEKPLLDTLVNIGYFLFEPEVFDYLGPFALEGKPLAELAQQGQLSAHKHKGFWHPMDTQRELEELNAIWDSGDIPWKIW